MNNKPTTAKIWRPAWERDQLLNVDAGRPGELGMQFLVLGYDGTDEHALERRMAAREAHIAGCDELHKSGQMLYGAAILNDDGKMIGSAIICEFASRAELDAWLQEEAYVKGKVWDRIEISQCKVGPSFAHLLPQQSAK